MTVSSVVNQPSIQSSVLDLVVPSTQAILTREENLLINVVVVENLLGLVELTVVLLVIQKEKESH